MSQRLLKEYKEAAKSKDEDIKLSVEDNNLFKWIAWLQGYVYHEVTRLPVMVGVYFLCS